MAISRAQMEEQIKGYSTGDPVIADPFGLETQKQEAFAAANIPTPTESLRQQLDALERARTKEPLELETPSFDFDVEYKDYQTRLKELLGKPNRLSFYDLLSDLGQAMLTTDPTVGPFRAAGVGFANFNQKLQKKREEKRALDQQAGLKAFEFARADEQAATDYLNKRNLEKIKEAARKPDLIKIQYDILDDTGKKTGVGTVDVDANNPVEVDLARSLPGATEVDTPQNQITLNQGNDKFSEQRAKSFSTTLDEIEKESKNAEEIIFNVQQLDAAAQRINYDVGVLAQTTRGARQLLSELGIRYDSNLGDQQLIDTINTRLALLLVAQTKGPISDREMTTFQRAMPGLAATPDGLKKQIQYMLGLANYQVKFFADYNKDTELQKMLDSPEIGPVRKQAIYNNWRNDWKKRNPRIILPKGSDTTDFTISELGAQFGNQEDEKSQSVREQSSMAEQSSISLPGPDEDKED